jgi:uncharacterized protein RhaS with RHS repeats
VATSTRLSASAAPFAVAAMRSSSSPTRLLQTKTDAKGTALTYTYDANDSVTQIAGGGQTTTFTYETGSDNRTSASVTGGGST